MKKLLIPFMLLSLSVAAQEKKTCRGTTKAGNQCKSVIVSKQGFCRTHNPNAVHCAGITASGKTCGMIVKVKGDKCRFHAK